MFLRFVFLVIFFLHFHQPTNGSECTDIQEHILELQNQILEKQLKLITSRSVLAQRMDHFERALQTLTQHVKSNINKLSTKLKRAGSRLIGVSSNVQTNSKLLEDLKKDKCQSGIFGLHTRTPSWPRFKKITFNPPFSSTPSVAVGFVILDAISSRNLRAAAETYHISRTGFTIKLNTWADTVLYGLRVQWMACR